MSFAYTDPAYANIATNLGKIIFGDANSDALVARRKYLEAEATKTNLESEKLRRAQGAQNTLANLVSGLQAIEQTPASEYEGPLLPGQNRKEAFGAQSKADFQADRQEYLNDTIAPNLGSLIMQGLIDRENATGMNLLPGMTDGMSSRGYLASGKTIGPDDNFSIQGRNNNPKFQADTDAANALAEQRRSVADYNKTARSNLANAKAGAADAKADNLDAKTENERGAKRDKLLAQIGLIEAKTGTEGARTAESQARRNKYVAELDTIEARTKNLDARTKQILDTLPGRKALLDAQTGAANSLAEKRKSARHGGKPTRMPNDVLEGVEFRAAMAAGHDATAAGWEDFLGTLSQAPTVQEAFYGELSKAWAENPDPAFVTQRAVSFINALRGEGDDLDDIGPDTPVPSLGDQMRPGTGQEQAAPPEPGSQIPPPPPGYVPVR